MIACLAEAPKINTIENLNRIAETIDHLQPAIQYLKSYDRKLKH